MTITEEYTLTAQVNDERYDIPWAHYPLNGLLEMAEDLTAVADDPGSIADLFVVSAVPFAVKLAVSSESVAELVGRHTVEGEFIELGFELSDGNDVVLYKTTTKAAPAEDIDGQPIVQEIMDLSNDPVELASRFPITAQMESLNDKFIGLSEDDATLLAEAMVTVLVATLQELRGHIAEVHIYDPDAE